MSKPNVILLSAHAQNGKDFTANIMKQELESMGKKVLITHYADLLKYICKSFFGWDGIKNEKGRTILQYVGTDIIRKQNPNYWVHFIRTFISMFKDEWDYILIPDTRFPNEIEEMKSCKYFNTYSIRINRPNFISFLTDEQKKHESEIALDYYDFDFYISNTTKDDVTLCVKNIIDIIEHRKNFFIDLDGTTINTIKAIVDLYDEDFKYYSDYKKNDWNDVKTWDFTELKAATPEYINLYFNQERFFNIVTMFTGARTVIKKISKNYNIVFVSHGYSPNLRLKEKWVSTHFPYADFIGVNLKEHSDKSCVDMSGGIFIDDSSNNLMKSNAEYKICFGKSYPWNENFNNELKDCFSCKDWNEVMYLFLNELLD